MLRPLFFLILTLILKVSADPKRSCQFLGGPDLLYVSKSAEAQALRDGIFRESNVERTVRYGELVTEKTFDGSKVVQEKTYKKNRLASEEVVEPSGNRTRTEYYSDGTVREVVHVINGVVDSVRSYDSTGEGTLTQYEVTGKKTFVTKQRSWGKVSTSQRLDSLRSDWTNADGTRWRVSGWTIGGSKRATFQNPATGTSGFVELFWQTPHGNFHYEKSNAEGKPKDTIYGQFREGRQIGEWVSRVHHKDAVSETVSHYSNGLLRDVTTTTISPGVPEYVITMNYNEDGLLEKHTTSPTGTHPSSVTSYYYGNEGRVTATHFHDNEPVSRRFILNAYTGRVIREIIYEGVEDRQHPIVIVYEGDTGRVAQRLEPHSQNLRSPAIIQTNYYESGLTELTRQKEDHDWAETTITADLGGITLRRVIWNTRTGEVKEESKYNQNGELYERYVRNIDHAAIAYYGSPYILLIDYDSGTHVSYQMGNRQDSVPRKSDTIPRNGRNNKQIIEWLIRNWR